MQDAEQTSDEYLAEVRKQLREHDDGAIIVDLKMPIKMGDSTRRTLSVRTVKVRDVRAARRSVDGLSMDAYADELVEPKGAFDLIECDDDCAAVIIACGDQVGKYRRGGRAI
jgi:hypothetical protein